MARSRKRYHSSHWREKNARKQQARGRSAKESMEFNQQFAPNGQVAQSPMKAEARRFGMIGHGSQFIEMQKL